MRKSHQYSPSYQQSESDSEDSESAIQYSKKNHNRYARCPRFIKNDIDLINPETIVINISRTQYQVIQQAAEELGWEVEYSKKSQKWDIMWIDSHIEAHDLFKLHQHQKISHFPAIYVLTKKNFLGRSLMKMNKYFPGEYNFFPATWCIPADLTDLMRQDEKIEKQGDEKPFYIFKPESQAQGKGIKIYNNIEKLKTKNGIVQVYVKDPFLIENLKFDLRIYVLILGYDPLRIFIYDEGLGRFATQPYQSVKKKNIKDVYMHLTNYAINKNHKNFIFNKSQKEMDRGHKRSLTAIYKYLQNKGIDVNELKNKIDEMIIKTLIVGQPMIAHTYSLAQADSSFNDICFQILGFDVLINENLQPILLQVNHTPSFKTETPLDKTIKKKLIKDTLVLLNVNVQNKREKINKKRQFYEMRAQGKIVKPSAKEKEVLRLKKWKQTEDYEQNNLGGYRKIFPTQKYTKQYSQMILFANKIFNEHNGFKNKQTRKIVNSSTTRPRSFENSKNINSLPSPVKFQKEEIVNKKAKIDQEDIKGLQKFPSISMQLRNSEKVRNYSGYMQTIKLQVNRKQQQDNKASSCSPIKKSSINKSKTVDIGKIENELTSKGSFLAPKLIDLNHIKSVRKEQLTKSESIRIPEPSAHEVVPIKPSKLNKFEQVSTQTSTVMHAQPKICNYSQLLNQLSANQYAKGSLSQNLSKSLKAKSKMKLPAVNRKQGENKTKQKLIVRQPDFQFI